MSLHADKKEKVEDYADNGVNRIRHPLMDDKQSILRCAETARKIANIHLERAASLLIKFKTTDWRLKERLRVLIASFIGSAPISEPRVKVLTAVLALLSDLVINEGFEKCEIAYQIYLEMSYATTCLAECQYYNQLSLNAFNHAESPHLGFSNANLAIDWLTEADMLTICLENRTALGSKGIGNHLSHFILRARKNLMGDMLRNRKLSRDHYKDLWGLWEIFDEIVAEVPHRDRPLVNEIRFMIKQALKCLKEAEKNWGII